MTTGSRDARNVFESSTFVARSRKRYINIKRLAHDRKWGDRFGDWLVKSVIQSLADMGEIVPEVETTHDRQGNVTAEKPSKNMFKLRDFS